MEHATVLDIFCEKFQQEKTPPENYSPLVLAYIGDAVYELIIRTYFVEKANIQAKKLHCQTVQFVKAKAQAEIILAIEDDLTEKEHTVFKRGRNAKSPSVAKHADIHDYRNATGFEALCGYLYLSDEPDRLMELIYMGLERLHMI